MTLAESFALTKKQFPSAEWVILRAPFGQNAGEGTLGLLSRVNGAEFLGRPPESMLFIGPEGSSLRLGRLHFFYRPEGWNTSLDQQAGTYRRAAHTETGRGMYELADFASLSDLVVPDPEPFWGGPRDVGVPLRPGRHVEVELRDYQYHHDPRTLMVLVRNIGDQPLTGLGVHWVYQNETAQPWAVEDIPVALTGGSLGLMSEEKFAGTLEPGRVEPFILPAFMIQAAANMAAALSPERYWLAVAADGEEVNRVDGRVVGGHLEQITAS